jgi:multidrug efflux pump subunit AcrA (membrane-fusion protein)
LTGLRKVLLVFVVLAIGGALVYVNVTFDRATGPEIEVEAVARRNLEALVSASGTIVPQLTVDISADTMGRVTRLAFNEGDRVDRGQFLMEIDPETLRSAVDRGEASLRASRSSERQLEVTVETARVNLKLARDNLVRQENLWDLRLVSREAYEQATTNVTLRETELQAREVDVQTQRERISQKKAKRWSSAP